MSSSSSSTFSSCSLKIIRNCIPSLHLFPSSSRQTNISGTSTGPIDRIEQRCIEIFGITAQRESPMKWMTPETDQSIGCCRACSPAVYPRSTTD